MKVTPKKSAALTNASTLTDLHRVVGSQPFFVVVPCASRLRPGEALNGTRITLTPGREDSFDFSICSASTPERFAQYEDEMDSLFARLSAAFVDDEALQIDGSANEDAPVLSKVTRLALEFFYYWVNFAPLSRGTSATGYAALYALILASGQELQDRVPHMKQLDWEAIICLHPDEFIKRVGSWFRQQKPTSVPSTWLHPSLTALHSEKHANHQYFEHLSPDSVFTTHRDVIAFLSNISGHAL